MGALHVNQIIIEYMETTPQFMCYRTKIERKTRPWRPYLSEIPKKYSIVIRILFSFFLFPFLVLLEIISI